MPYFYDLVVYGCIKKDLGSIPSVVKNLSPFRLEVFIASEWIRFATLGRMR
jgi:hypothetical protein